MLIPLEVEYETVSPNSRFKNGGGELPINHERGGMSLATIASRGLPGVASQGSRPDTLRSCFNGYSKASSNRVTSDGVPVKPPVCPAGMGGAAGAPKIVVKIRFPTRSKPLAKFVGNCRSSCSKAANGEALAASAAAYAPLALVNACTNP